MVVAILAGGKSSRMGTDKANLTINGETILARTARMAYIVSEPPPLIVGRETPKDWNAVPARFISDEAPPIGPAGGLRTALRYAGDLPLLALSCDLPALTEEALVWLSLQRLGEYGVVVRNGDQLEPLFAVYTPPCLKLLLDNIAAGKRSLHALIQAGDTGFNIVDAPGEIASALANVNTPEQWTAFLEPEQPAP